MDFTDGRALLGVGGGDAVIGYQLFVPLNSSSLDIVPGKVLEFHVHTHVREDALDLYGFTSRMDRELFLTVLTVNGIGPKGALGLLSKIESSQLIEMVLAEDKDGLCQVPGIGKKTAERVVLELKTPFQKKIDAGSWILPGTGATAAGPAVHAASLGSEKVRLQREAKEALLGLGYREAEVASLIKKIFEDRPEVSRVEEIIKLSLQRMA